MLESTVESCASGGAIGLTWRRPLGRRVGPIAKKEAKKESAAQPAPRSIVVSIPVAAATATVPASLDVVEELTRHRAILRAYLRMQLGRHGDIDELEQDISVALWSEAAAFQAERSFTAWMLGFARIHVLRWRQKRARDQRIVALDDLGHDNLVWAGEQIAAEGDAAGALQRCIQNVDSPSIDLLRWRYSDGLALADIAKRLRLSIATTSRRLSRLVQVLDGCIRKQLDQPDPAAL